MTALNREEIRDLVSLAEVQILHEAAQAMADGLDATKVAAQAIAQGYLKANAWRRVWKDRTRVNEEGEGGYPVLFAEPIRPGENPQWVAELRTGPAELTRVVVFSCGKAMWEHSADKAFWLERIDEPKPRKPALRPFTREELEARFSWEFRLKELGAVSSLRRLRFVTDLSQSVFDHEGTPWTPLDLLHEWQCRPPWSGEGPVPEWRACGVEE